MVLPASSGAGRSSSDLIVKMISLRLLTTRGMIVSVSGRLIIHYHLRKVDSPSRLVVPEVHPDEEVPAPVLHPLLLVLRGVDVC